MIATNQACSTTAQASPGAMIYSESNIGDGWGSAIQQWLSGGDSYDYGAPGRNSYQTLSWSQV